MEYNILLTTDFSANAWTATAYTLKLYAKEKCNFYFLNSIDINAAMRSKYSSEVLKKMQEDAKRLLLDLKASAEKEHANPNHNFHTILSINNLNKAVDKAIETHHIDFVLMGAKGATGAKEFFVGGNTMRLINGLIKRPVLVVPEKPNFIIPKQIGFLTDYNRSHSALEIEPLKKLVDLHHSKIAVVHIHKNEELNDTQQQNQKNLRNHLADYDYSLHWIPKLDNKSEKINEFILEKGIDMLVLVNFKLSLIERIIKDPLIKKIGYEPIVPFLVIPE